MPCSKQKLPMGHLRLRKPWPEQALNRHRIRWKPLRKGWAKYRLRRSMLLDKPWRVRVLPMTLGTRPHVSRLWPACGALLVSWLQTTWMTSANDAVSAPNPPGRKAQGRPGLGTTRCLEGRAPAMYQLRENVLAGGLMSYGASQPDLFRRAAGYVHKILQGTKPADLPVEQPVKFDLVVNLKTAKALGLTIPESFLLRTDEVIE
jgi:hypothetical protein